MFDLGCDAVGLLFPDASRGYVCPTCQKLFTEADLRAGSLTREHVPPKRLGGTVLALTCSHCNSTAGATVDAAWGVREDFHDFEQRTLEAPLWPLVLQQGGSEVRVSAVWEDGRLVLTGVPAANHPDASQAHTDYLDELVSSRTGDGETFRITGWAHNPVHARVGVLRAAYLAVFAAYGYRYVLAAGLEKVRSQLATPDEDICAEELTSFDPSQDVDRREILVVDEPARGVVVRMGRAAAFIPAPDGSGDEVIPPGVPFHYFRRIEWPETLVLALDFASEG